MAKKKEKINIVYSTNPNFNYQFDEENEPETLQPDQQKLYVSIDRRHFPLSGCCFAQNSTRE